MDVCMFSSFYVKKLRLKLVMWATLISRMQSYTTHKYFIQNYL